MNFNFREFWEKHRITLQLAYGIALIALIPLMIIFNTVSIIGKYNRGIDITLQRHALSFGRSLSTLMENDLPWDDFVQMKIEALTAGNQDIRGLEVLKPEAGGFRIIASSDKKKIGRAITSEYYKSAWAQPKSGGLAVDSSGLLREFAGEEAAPDRGAAGFWLVAIPMLGSSGEKEALLTVSLSSEIVDELTKDNRDSSIYLLIGTLLIVVLFLLSAARLWDYAILYRKMKELDGMKDEFISMASHELRTPVAGIRGYASMALEGDFGPLGDKLGKVMFFINDSTERLGVLVDDLLNVSQIEQGRIPIRAEVSDVGPILKRTVAEMEIQAKKKGLSLSYCPHVEPLPLIEIDHARFKEVMINLIGNSIKYTLEGGIEIVTGEKFDHRLLEIVVKDSGVGMSAREKDNLFKKFYRAKNDKVKAVPGTGLGLWITKQLTELMGGRITIESIENVGTEVILQFPIPKANKQ